MIDLMRWAAIQRHLFINRVFENSCPIRWRDHMQVVRFVYGY